MLEYATKSFMQFKHKAIFNILKFWDWEFDFFMLQ